MKSTQDPSGRLKRRVTLLASGFMAIALMAAACSSSSKTTTPTTAGSSGSSSSSSSSSTPSGGGDTGVAGAQAFIAKYSQQPTQITATGKVTGTIPQGKTVDFVPCGPNPECQQEGQIVAQAAHLVGWNEVTISNDGTPQGDKAAFDQVVRNKPAAVLYTAIPQAVFQSDVAALKANGTVVSACCVTDAVGNGIDFNIDDPTEGAIVGQAQAAIVAADSQCQNADAVIVNIPDFAILANGVSNFKSWMSKYCPSAAVSEADVALANIATANTTIVAYVRSHPNVKYVVASTDGITIGLPAALKAAGQNVKLVGQGATPTNLQYLKGGQEIGDVAFAYNEIMYAMLGPALQKAAGEAITPSVGPPLWILTPTNAPNTSAAIFPVVNDFQAQYKALWGVS